MIDACLKHYFPVDNRCQMCGEAYITHADAGKPTNDIRVVWGDMTHTSHFSGRTEQIDHPNLNKFKLFHENVPAL
jgi:hypothetical protein